jgi:hypothetical protein
LSLHVPRYHAPHSHMHYFAVPVAVTCTAHATHLTVTTTTTAATTPQICDHHNATTTALLLPPQHDATTQ